ncbi:MAG: helix-turn-helix domain-containing protein [Verrucomicrobiaceae bacterium]|nr:helix-turn-helix domain-containing protein [Verrucomicrobiaceae bacterium]
MHPEVTHPPAAQKGPTPEQRAHLDAEVALWLELLGRLVNTRRNELEMSQQEMAARAGLSRTCLHHIEHGDTDEKITTLFRVCRALRMGFAEVVAHLEHLLEHPEDRPPKTLPKSQRGKNTRRSPQRR